MPPSSRSDGGPSKRLDARSDPAWHSAMPSVKVSSKFQIAVPSEARQHLGIVAGDRLTVTIENDQIVLRRRAAKAFERLWGLGRGLYGPDPVAIVRVDTRRAGGGVR